MRKINYPKYFWIVLLVAIVIDTSFDFIAFNQTHLADVTGDMVVRTYAVLEEFTLIGAAVRENLHARLVLNKTSLNESLASLKIHIAKSRELVRDNAERSKDLAALSFVSDLSDKNGAVSSPQLDLISQTIFAARKSEEESLKRHLQRDEEQSRIAQKQVLIASSVDIALLLLAGCLWVLESRVRRENESVLTDAMQSLNESNSELRSVLTLKAKQMRSTVHDLKNPLGSISGFAELLADDFDKPSSVLEMSNVIQRISKHTLELVSSLVESEALQKKSKGKFEALDITHYISEVCVALKPQLAKKNQHLEFDCAAQSLEISGERGKILDLFTNLIGNAVKFAPVGGHIKIRLSALNGNVRVEIEDDGPGFSESDRGRAFGEFESLSAKPTGGEHSSGLGLHLAKEVVESHLGRLEIARRPGTETGALLVVEIPEYRDETWS